jgi:hypothetical protein
VIGLPPPREKLVVADGEIGPHPAPDALEGRPVVRRDREQKAIALTLGVAHHAVRGVDDAAALGHELRLVGAPELGVGQGPDQSRRLGGRLHGRHRGQCRGCHVLGERRRGGQGTGAKAGTAEFRKEARHRFFRPTLRTRKCVVTASGTVRRKAMRMKKRGLSDSHPANISRSLCAENSCVAT